MKTKITLLALLFTMMVNAQCWDKIYAKGYNVTGIRTDGTLWLWGSNDDGQLGDGTTLKRNAPTQLLMSGIANDDWESINTGTTTLAIKKDGTIWGWGSCEYGELANDTDVDNLDKLVPVRIGSKSDWLMAQSSVGISFGIKKNGTLWVWGTPSSYPSQFSDLFGSTSPIVEDTFIYQVGTDTDWQSISVGDGFTHAIKTNGTLWAYGDNQYGTLGDGTNNNSSKFKQIGNGVNWKYISTGNSTIIGVMIGGELYAWGSNVGAAFGNGTKDDISWYNNPTTHNSPARIGNEKWRSASTSGFQTLAISDTGTLYVWGINSYYSTDSSIDKTIPQQVGAKNTWKSVATSDNVSLPLLNSGNLYSWGYNFSGELGDPQSGGFSFRYSDDPYFIGCACSTVEPSGISNQSFCNGAKLSDIILTGTNVRWYTEEYGGYMYTSNITLVDGQTYYASQTINECESTKRLAVKVAVTTVPEPTGEKEQSFCSTNLSPKTLSDLLVNGTNLRWYDSLTDGNVLNENTPLYSDKIYYVCSVINGCESTRLGIKTIDFMSPPAGESNQTFCEGSTLNDVITNSIGRKWYLLPNGGLPLSESTVLENATTYYASQSFGIQAVGFCESTKRLAVTITLNVMPAPNGQTSQTLYNKKFLSDIVLEGNLIKYYDSAQGGILLNSTDLLVNNKKYYCSQTIGTCESLQRLEVLVTLTYTQAPTLGTGAIPINPQINDIDIVGSNIKWYASLIDFQSGNNQLSQTAYLQNGTTYYITQTVDGFTSVDALVLFYNGLTLTLSSNDFSLINKNVSVYPNPTKYVLNFSQELSDIKVLDMSGKQVFSNKSKTKNISVENLPKGNYLITGKNSKNETISEKFIKE